MLWILRGGIGLGFLDFDLLCKYSGFSKSLFLFVWCVGCLCKCFYVFFCGGLALCVFLSLKALLARRGNLKSPLVARGLFYPPSFAEGALAWV